MLQDLERQMDALERQEVVEVTVEPRLRTFYSLVSFGGSRSLRAQETYRFV